MKMQTESSQLKREYDDRRGTDGKKLKKINAIPSTQIEALNFNFIQTATPFFDSTTPPAHIKIQKRTIKLAATMNSHVLDANKKISFCRQQKIDELIALFEIFIQHTKPEPKQRVKKQSKLEAKLEWLKQQLQTDDPGLHYISLAKSLNLSRCTIRRYCNAWRQRKNSIYSTKKKFVLKQEHTEFLLEYCKQNKCIASACEMKEQLIKKFNFDATKFRMKTFYDTLKRIKITFKKILPVYPKSDTLENMHERREVAIKFIDYLINEYYVIFIDETSFRFDRSYIPKAWSKSGTTPILKKPLQSANHTLICAISLEGIEGCQICVNSVTADMFFYYIHCLYLKVEKRTNKKVVFFWDGAPIHRSKMFLPYFSSKICILFNAPYSPDMNPIENFFSHFKRQVKQKGFTDRETLLKSIIEVVQSYDRKHIAGFYYNCLKYMKKALEMQSFK